MRHRFTSVVILLVASLFVAADAPRGPSTIPRTDPDRLVVHEWGTFTSVAAEDGSAVEWLPAQGPQDLPCFVDRVRSNLKGWLPATVRMETPVLYFYSAQERTVDVRVRFRRGIVTEWYPKAAVAPASIETTTLRNRALEGTVAWNRVRIVPAAPEEYPVEIGDNHYYAARKTDASPIEVGQAREKFLFYRGIGNFALPLRATIGTGGAVAITAPKGLPVGDVMLFENHGGSAGYHARRAVKPEITIERPVPTRRAAAAQEALERMLVAHGLFSKEAAAMVETWRDSWFEEGLRLFYIVPRGVIDDILPLEINPAPASVARVFVGRIEIITPASVAEVKEAVLRKDRAPIVKYARFLKPILARAIAASTAPEAAALERNLQFAYASVGPRAATCR